MFGLGLEIVSEDGIDFDKLRMALGKAGQRIDDSGEKTSGNLDDDNDGSDVQRRLAPFR